MRSILIDTNAYSDLMRGDRSVLKTLESSETIFVSVFVLAELYTGFKGGKNEKENLIVLERFLDKPTVVTLNTTIETASIFAEIKHFLKKKGKPIPLNDVWIAAHTLEMGCSLLTKDEHFSLVPGLRLV